MSTVERFKALCNLRGSDVLYHREAPGIACPCRTPEGSRDLEWHFAHPPGLANPALAGPPFNGINPPICNEQAMQNVVTADYTVKGFVQPIQSTRATRLSTEYLDTLFGDVQANDHLAILPYEWQGHILDLNDWSDSGEDYIGYNNMKFIVVNGNALPDPSDGNPNHHWEAGLRFIA